MLSFLANPVMPDVHAESFVESPARKDRRGSSLRAFVVFGLVGVFGTACQYFVLWALVHWTALDVVAASTIGAVVGAVVNFFLNHHATFDAQASVGRTGPRFVVLVAISLIANALLVHLVITAWHAHYLVAQGIATGIVFLVNYRLCSLWVFTDRNTDQRTDTGQRAKALR